MKKIFAALLAPVLLLFSFFGGLFTGAWIGLGVLRKQKRRSRDQGEG